MRKPIAAIRTVLALIVLGLMVQAGPAAANPDGLEVIDTPYGFEELETRLAAAIEDAGMLRVFKASASRFAKTRGVDMPDDSVYGVFRNDFAVTMIEANPLAGTEAPILFHVMGNPDGAATLAYKRPSAVFAPYDDPTGHLRAMAAELDIIFAMIAAQATAK